MQDKAKEKVRKEYFRNLKHFWKSKLCAKEEMRGGFFFLAVD